MEWDPERYLTEIRIEIRRFDEFQTTIWTERPSAICSDASTPSCERAACSSSGDVVVSDRPEDAQIEIDWVADLPDRADDQPDWLHDAGFVAELVWSRRDLAVIRATRHRLRPSAPGDGEGACLPTQRKDA
jgi:hypothetical protein